MGGPPLIIRVVRTPLNLMRLFFWGVFRNFILLLGPGSIPVLEGAIAAAYFRLAGRKREIIRKELRRSFGDWPDEKIEAAVRESFRVYVGFQVKNLFLQRLNPSNIGRYIPVEGIEHLDEALREDKGALILNPHFGPYLLIMPALGHRGYTVNQLALHGEPPTGRKGLEKTVYEVKFRNIQGRMPAKFIDVALKENVRKSVEVLKNKEVLLFPSTGRGGRGWAGVKLINRPALLNTGPVKMAKMTSSALIPVFVIYGRPFAKVIIEKPLDLDGEDEAILQRYADLMTSYIERHPGHFGQYIYEMFTKSHWDDHPFFSDYGTAGRKGT